MKIFWLQSTALSQTETGVGVTSDTVTMGMSGCQALEEWCRLLLNTYPGVNIVNMTSSWSDGRAFCALIHSHRPDLIPWDIVSYNAQK